MRQKSEERVSDPVIAPATTARVIPFERPQSELQKAVQQRAQETIDRERDRANQKAPAWRRALVFVLAVIPVVLTFGAAVGFVGALRQFNATVFDSAPARQAPPAATDAPTTQRDPGVVMLQPLAAPHSAPQTDRSSPADKSK